MSSTISHIAKEDTAKPSKAAYTPENSEKKLIFWETVNIIFKTTGVITWFIILLLTILEIKRYFNLDLIPGYNSAVDDAYNAVRNILIQ